MESTSSFRDVFFSLGVLQTLRQRVSPEAPLRTGLVSSLPSLASSISALLSVLRLNVPFALMASLSGH